MTLHDLQGLTRYWRHYPPTHISLGAIARGLGMQSRGEAKKQATTDMSELVNLMGRAEKFKPPCRMIETPNHEQSGNQVHD